MGHGTWDMGEGMWGSEFGDGRWAGMGGSARCGEWMVGLRVYAESWCVVGVCRACVIRSGSSWLLDILDLLDCRDCLDCLDLRHCLDHLDRRDYPDRLVVLAGCWGLLVVLILTGESMCSTVYA